MRRQPSSSRRGDSFPLLSLEFEIGVDGTPLPNTRLTRDDPVAS